MKPKVSLSISITYRTPEDIKEVEELSREVSKAWKQAHIYMVGLRTVSTMLKKAKTLVK